MFVPVPKVVNSAYAFVPSTFKRLEHLPSKHTFTFFSFAYWHEKSKTKSVAAYGAVFIVIDAIELLDLNLKGENLSYEEVLVLASKREWSNVKRQSIYRRGNIAPYKVQRYNDLLPIPEAEAVIVPELIKMATQPVFTPNDADGWYVLKK